MRYAAGVTAPAWFNRALAAFDAIDMGDPKRVKTDRGDEPFAAVYHRTLAAWVERLAVEPGLALRTAARCQHLGRYRLPRERFPEGLAGYKKSRTFAALEQEATATAILTEAGLEEPDVARVGNLLMKRGLNSVTEVALFEAAICLTFLELELDAFAAKHDEPKTVLGPREDLGKDAPAGRDAALTFSERLTPAIRQLVSRAIQTN